MDLSALVSGGEEDSDVEIPDLHEEEDGVAHSPARQKPKRENATTAKKCPAKTDGVNKSQPQKKMVEKTIGPKALILEQGSDIGAEEPAVSAVSWSLAV